MMAEIHEENMLQENSFSESLIQVNNVSNSRGLHEEANNFFLTAGEREIENNGLEVDNHNYDPAQDQDDTQPIEENIPFYAGQQEAMNAGEFDYLEEMETGDG